MIDFQKSVTKALSYNRKQYNEFLNDDLLTFTKNLISYPYAVFNEDGLRYTDLDISHPELPFIIKISGHLCIDFLSTDQKLLKEVAGENPSNRFIIKEYRGTLLG